MLKIDVQVPENRDHTAIVKIGTGFVPQAMGFAAASVWSDIAARHGNPTCDPLRPWGHVPSGLYQLIAHGPAPRGCEKEYGKHLLAFQPASGEALAAESFGRLVLLAYAGPTDAARRLRRTQGGLRFDQKFMDALVGRLAAEPDVILEVHPAQKRRWWRFWGTDLPAIPLSPEAPRFRDPPLDEASLAEALSAGKRRARTAPARTDDDRDWGRDRSRSSSSSSTSGSSYSGGRGGEYGGAGASGSWDSPASSGAGRGVDASGRIVAAAAIGAATAAALHASAQESGEGGGGGSGGDADGGGSSGSVDTSSGTSY